MVEYTIPEATWIVFENDGTFKEDVQDVFRRFMTEFLPFSGFEYAELPDIRLFKENREQVIQKYGLLLKRRESSYVSFKVKRRALSNGR